MRRVSGTGLWDTGKDGTGQPVELETVWTLSKRGKVAACVLLTHQLGWELRIDSGDGQVRQRRVGMVPNMVQPFSPVWLLTLDGQWESCGVRPGLGSQSLTLVNAVAGNAAVPVRRFSVFTNASSAW